MLLASAHRRTDDEEQDSTFIVKRDIAPSHDPVDCSEPFSVFFFSSSFGCSFFSSFFFSSTICVMIRYINEMNDKTQQA